MSEMDREQYSDVPPEETPEEAERRSEDRTEAVPEDRPEEPEEFTHYVHLADGRVVKVNQEDPDAGPLGTHYEEGEDDDLTRTQIIGVYPR